MELVVVTYKCQKCGNTAQSLAVMIEPVPCPYYEPNNKPFPCKGEMKEV